MRINMLAKFTQQPAAQAIFPVNYAPALIFYWLAGFICVTWLVLYNYLTFTTSGVFGSVISLFISTMLYVILDIQLIKQPADTVSAPAEQQQETPN
jgi:hypothetical protein